MFPTPQGAASLKKACTRICLNVYLFTHMYNMYTYTIKHMILVQQLENLQIQSGHPTLDGAPQAAARHGDSGASPGARIGGSAVALGTPQIKGTPYQSPGKAPGTPSPEFQGPEPRGSGVPGFGTSKLLDQASKSGDPGFGADLKGFRAKAPGFGPQTSKATILPVLFRVCGRTWAW